MTARRPRRLLAAWLGVLLKLVAVFRVELLDGDDRADGLMGRGVERCSRDGCGQEGWDGKRGGGRGGEGRVKATGSYSWHFGSRVATVISREVEVVHQDFMS